jgi:integrase
MATSECFLFRIYGIRCDRRQSLAASRPSAAGSFRPPEYVAVLIALIWRLFSIGTNATLTYGFARIGAALKMRVEDLQSKGSGWLIRLHEKGGKQHMMPCHHALAEALRAYIDAAGISADKKAFLFRTSRGHGGTTLADQPMTQVDAWRMVRKRALAAGILAPIGNHSFRATSPQRPDASAL